MIIYLAARSAVAAVLDVPIVSRRVTSELLKTGGGQEVGLGCRAYSARHRCADRTQRWAFDFAQGGL